MKLRESVATYTQSYCADTGECTESRVGAGESMRFDTQYDIWRGNDEMFMFLPVKAHSFGDSRRTQTQKQLLNDLTIT